MKCKLRVTDVSTGMYVAELDRPWLESPFLFQGFTVESRRELTQLRETCHYVYVDVERSRADLQARIRRQAVLDRGRAGSEVAEEPPVEHRFKAIKRELARALDIREKARQYVDVLMDDARLGKHVSIQGVRTVVTELLDTILVNPAASLWLMQLREKDHHTAQHCVNTAVISMIFARHEGLSRDAIENVGVGGLLHDLGKVKMPRDMLHREGPLSEDELKVMRSHPEHGLRLLDQSGGVTEAVKRIVIQHHERLDGSGYPNHLIGRQVDQLAILVGLVDHYDALCGDWPGAPAIAPHRALAILRREHSEGFGAERIERFIKCLGVYPVGSVVQLNNGAKGMVVAHNRGNRLKPVLMMVEDPRGEPYRKRPLINLAAPRSGAAADWLIEGVLDPSDFGEDKIRNITTTETIL